MPQEPSRSPEPRLAAAPAGPGHPAGYRVRSAPYALVRTTVLTHPPQGPEAERFRALLARLHRTETRLLRTTAPLCDDLYASRDGHPAEFHRDVVLPLRRALHNGREPRPALLARLGDLPERVPRLADWTALRARRRALLAELDATAGPALAAEREALAALCREPALAKAVALTSADLLRAVRRAAGGADDRKTRKEEATVLRHALRACTKTSPLSWFTAVGWGALPSARTGTRPSWGEPGLLDGPLHAVVKPNRTLTTALTLALLDAPHRRARLPHRITSSARTTDGRAAYSRDRTAFAGGRYLVAREDEAELPAGGPLGLVTEHAADPVPLGELAGRLTSALRQTGPAAGPAAEAFLARLTEAGLLVPADPVPPQSADPLHDIEAWLRPADPARPAGGAERAGDAERAGRVAGIGRLTEAFGAAAAEERPALLAELADRWAAELADAGRPVPAGSAPLTVLSEDVVAPLPMPLDGFLDTADHTALAEVTALAELFDLGHLLRRVVRDRFVARYGPGGTCRHPWEFGAEVTEAWETAGRLADLDPADRAALPTGTEELAALRAGFTAAVRDARAQDPADAAEVVLPPGPVRALGGHLPGWALERPLSYAYFLQRDPDRGLLAVNHVYGGWGRFGSRFLDVLDPRATAETARQIRRGLAPGARAAQIRPVGGFNANLHPLLVDDEIGPDRRRASIAEGDLELVHDEPTDQVRLRLRSTGEHLDVLYPGFLAPVLLPRRIAAHLCDHPHGVVDFRSLAPRRVLTAPGGRVVHSPRLLHRHVVLRRRRWQLTPGVVRELRAELAAAPAPAETAARWRALLDLPEQLFLHPAATAPTGRPAEDFLSRLSRPKPHFVDLGSALHLRCLPKWLSRHGDGAVLEEALPAPGGPAAPARAVELVLEVYRSGRPR
ncbi:lantibiotic dehydratase [Streptomyces lavendulae]|uniref:lantibiotic dehydratase n=1 Tax=Streptomyces lavendulae TaxID=1914 RepID=UPI0036A2BEDE